MACEGFALSGLATRLPDGEWGMKATLFTTVGSVLVAPHHERHVVAGAVALSAARTPGKLRMTAAFNWTDVDE